MKKKGNLTVDVCLEMSLNQREGCFPHGVCLVQIILQIVQI